MLKWVNYRGVFDHIYNNITLGTFIDGAISSEYKRKKEIDYLNRITILIYICAYMMTCTI